MSKVIKGGMGCTADRTWKADVLIEGEIIKQIGEDLMHAVELAAQPDPVDIRRVDIHG